MTAESTDEFPGGPATSGKKTHDLEGHAATADATGATGVSASSKINTSVRYTIAFFHDGAIIHQGAIRMPITIQLPNDFPNLPIVTEVGDAAGHLLLTVVHQATPQTNE